MKISTTLTRVALGLASAAHVAQAWPDWMPPLDSLYVRRADSEVGQNTAVASTTSSSSSSSSASSTSAGAFTITETGTSSSTGTSKSTSKSTSKATTAKTTTAKTTTTHHSGNSTSTSYTGAEAGSMSMISPTTAAYKPLYKAGDYVTWEWNYTNVQATPTAIDLILSCSSITQSWTLTANMSWTTPVTFTWDSSVQANNAQHPLVPNNYTLVVKDSDEAITAAAEAGYLAVQSTFTFGIYTPQPYTSLADWDCTTCVVGGANRYGAVLVPMILTSLMTSIGFLWFINGLAL